MSDFAGMPASHFIFIPAVLLVGVQGLPVTGFDSRRQYAVRFEGIHNFA